MTDKDERAQAAAEARAIRDAEWERRKRRAAELRALEPELSWTQLARRVETQPHIVRRWFDAEMNAK